MSLTKTLRDALRSNDPSVHRIGLATCLAGPIHVYFWRSPLVRSNPSASELCLTKFALVAATRSSPSPPTSHPQHDRQVPPSPPKSLFVVRVAVVTDAQTWGRGAFVSKSQIVYWGPQTPWTMNLFINPVHTYLKSKFYIKKLPALFQNVSPLLYSGLWFNSMVIQLCTRINSYYPFHFFYLFT